MRLRKFLPTNLFISRQRYWLFFGLLVAGGLFFAAGARAEVGVIEGFVADVLGWIVFGVCWVLGQLLLVVVSVLITVAQYNKFIDFPAVTQGWIIVRDLCNMFFILILLIIAFATILRIQGYSIKQLLKKVIIAALLINFSKLICGVIIDFGQVIMLTFVNGFKDVGGASFTSLLGIDQLLSIRPADTSGYNEVTLWGILGSYILALLYTIIMLVVIIALLATLVFRVVMIWIYVILSPIAYLASVLPHTSKVTGTWWSQFTNQVITGPILAFFIWLSLATLGQFQNADTAKWMEYAGFNNPQEETTKLQFEQPTVGLTQVGTSNHMLRFVVSLGLLLGGLIVAKQFGGMAGNAAGTALGKIQGGAGWMKAKAARGAKAVGAKAWQGAKAGGAAAGRGALALGKTADYRGSKKFAEWRAKQRGETGFEYAHKQGGLTRGIALARQTITPEGIKRKFEEKRAFNRTKYAATEATENGGSFTYNNEKYKLDNGRLVSASGKPLTVNGKEVTPFSGVGADLHRFYRSGSKVSEADVAKTGKAQEEMESMSKRFEGHDDAALHGMLGSATDPKIIEGILWALTKKGKLNNGEYNALDGGMATKFFGKNTDKLKAFREKVFEKQGDNNFNLGDIDQAEAFKKWLERGKFNLKDQTFAHLNTDTTDGKAQMAALMLAIKDGLGARFKGQISALEKEGDQGKIKKVAEGLSTVIKGFQAASPNRKDPREFDLGRARVLLTGDVAGSFRDKKSINEFIGNSSINDLQAINPGQLRRGSPDFNQDVYEAVASHMNYAKLRGLGTKDDAGELVHLAATAMADVNHAEASKIPYNISNTINVNINASNQNSVIQEQLRRQMGLQGKSLDKLDINDYKHVLEPLRQGLENISKNSKAGGKPGVDYFAPGKKGGLKGTKELEMAIESYVKTLP